MHKLVVAFTLCLFISCGEDKTVYFSEPQPLTGKVLDKLPTRYRGVYVNKTDDSRLYIDEQGIVREYNYTFKVHRDSLYSEDSLSNDTIFHILTGEFDVINIQGSYLTQNIHWVDTLFVINGFPYLKKYKGYLFLNTADQNGYEVKQMKLKKGILEINSITTLEEIQLLNEFEENDSDTISSPYTPSKREFKKFIRTEGFQEGEQFVKIE